MPFDSIEDVVAAVRDDVAAVLETSEDAALEADSPTRQFGGLPRSNRRAPL